MGANENEKHYWIETLRGEIRKKQAELLESVELTFEDLNKQAAAALFADIGVSDQVQKYLDLENEENKLKEKLTKVNNEKEKVRKDIANRADISYYDAYYLIAQNDIGVTKKGAEYRLKVISSLSIGEEYLKLEKSKNSVERAVRLASTSAQLKEFVEKFFKDLGIDPLGGE